MINIVTWGCGGDGGN